MDKRSNTSRADNKTSSEDILRSKWKNKRTKIKAQLKQSRDFSRFFFSPHRHKQKIPQEKSEE
ncbi:MAG: hypothetical protein DRM97_02445 [Thermoprotei archaeon]|nr:MAG: hypothetical protein DRM97_02445 [Thermoprotei archaeon]